METLQTPTKTEILKAFRQADDKGKELLESLFGKIRPQNITEKVLTLEDAYDVLGIDSEDSEKEFFEKHAKSIAAYRKLIVITEALNEGWKPNWDDDNEPKYYPWFYFDQPGFRLYSVIVGYYSSYVGSRLCFQKEEVAKYAATQFLSIYKEFMTL